jgi:peptidoglycan/LPS O-acetylase OafA/YrhL
MKRAAEPPAAFKPVLERESDAPFRPEIEGLRAVAAGLVAVFHIWLGRVSGGVDVFIVVSGFLITTSLFGEVERSGRIQFARFWSRLAGRLIPAAMLVLLAVVVASMFWLPTSRWRDTIPEVAASAAYVQNWVLAAKSVDYLAQHQVASPIQHYWALSVQGQFYLLWPMLVTLGLLAATRLKVTPRLSLLMLFGVVFALSLGYSAYITARDQPFAYFSSFARVWEFSLGALLALALPQFAPRKSLRIALGWIGLFAILSCGLILTVSRVFPGYLALWPTLAAVCIIAAGNTHSRFGVDRLLASRPMVYLGKISYGIYLWHFPILVFFRNSLAPQSIDFQTGVVIIASAVLLAAATERWLETPIRKAGLGRANAAQALALIAACAVPVGAGLALWSSQYIRLRNEARAIIAPVDDPSYPGAAALEPGFVYRGKAGVPVYPGPLAVDGDRTFADHSNCGLVADTSSMQGCTIGRRDATLTIAVVGGSHSAHWVPALEVLTRSHSWRVISFTRSNCPFHVGRETVSESEPAACHEWNEHVLAQVLRLKPDLVFTTSTRYTEEGEVVPDGYLEAWRHLGTSGIRVVAIRDNPSMAFDVSACVERSGDDHLACSRLRTDALLEPSPVSALREPPSNVAFIDLSRSFCNATHCFPTAGNVLIYRHGDHLTSTYSRTLAPMLEQELLRVLSR